jgi:crotonobetainyl-CoA:carnitine CoA-transferase CaiB-like acyl-CoA transferase
MAGPLAGLKVLDFTTLLPGPFATMMLSDLGADVLRVVSASRPDLVGFLPPFLPGNDVSAALAYLGRGKRCLSLNITMPQAAEIVRRLISQYDIIIEQFRPGVMARYGLDYESLRSVNPSIVYCSLTGYGQTGPMKDKAGHDINYLARSGGLSYSGRVEGGPSLFGIQIADLAGGSMNAVIGILASVVRRDRTGRGQYVDVSMTDGVMALNAMTGAGFLVDGQDPRREGEVLNGGTLYDFYETADGRHLSIGSVEPQFFMRLCRAIGRDDLADEGIAPLDLAPVKEQFRQIIRTKTLAEWREIFSPLDACVEPVFTLAEAFADPHAVERGMVVEVDAPQGGKVRQIASPLKFSETHQEYGSTGSADASGTPRILAEIGFTEDEIIKYQESGVLS